MQVEEEWKKSDPACICGFAMDRAAADAALRYQPVGAFLVRLTPEPGSFAISCRTSPDPHQVLGGAPATPFPGQPCCSYPLSLPLRV